ncbi:BafA family autotransporter [Bartonella sp. CB175]|uniref:BafA family autotransporter n=1 Tax=Bartonella sp. CB175 TaxID=3112256 RepID=UPI00300DDF28
MRCECKLGFSILMVSSCLVQVAGADESKNWNEGLKNISNNVGMMNGVTVEKGSALISKPVSQNVKILNGAAEIVEGSSTGTAVEEGGMQVITRGGSSINATINGGWQFVFEETGDMDLGISTGRKSSAYNTKILGTDETRGQQNVYDGGQSWSTEVKKGGEQNLYKGSQKEGGFASGTKIVGGRQNVLDGGKAEDTTLQGDGSIQVVYPGGIVNGLTIGNGASSWIYLGANLSHGKVKVESGGHLYLYAGDDTNRITKGKLSINGRSDENLFFVGVRSGKNAPWFLIENLDGQGDVSFPSVQYDKRHFPLRIENLSGSLHFNLDVIKGSHQHRNYLLIGNGSGDHKISVTDSGSEITDIQHPLVLITDRSRNGRAQFSLANSFGQKTTAIDGGTFMYGLYSREEEIKNGGGGSSRYTIWYLGLKSHGSDSLDSRSRRVSTGERSLPTVLSGAGKSEGSRRKSPSRSQEKNNNSGAYGNTSTQKKRPPRHLKEDQHPSVSMISLSSEGQTDEASHINGGYKYPDLEQIPPVPPIILPLRDQVHEASGVDSRSQSSNSKRPPVPTSLFDQVVKRSDDQDQRLSQAKQEIQGSGFLTTPSTDAVLSMSVNPGLIFGNELQAVRAGRGVLSGSKKNSALWTQAIKHKEHIATAHTDFKLEQTGVVLGINGLSELISGELYIGGFGSYDQARVAHARGGTSGIKSYSIGTYVTYFDHSGWYLDGVIKYNYYQNNLQAVSTNGSAIKGDYNQWAVGTSFETGYRFKMAESSWMQPYAQLTWLQVDGKEIKLSNRMIGNMGRSTSLRSEVGLSIGYEFGSGSNTPSMAYITGAWLRENIDKNHTTINKEHKFITDLSGNAGKLGIGLSSFINDKLSFYVEANYAKGHKIKQSLQGILGVRYSF